MLAPKKIKYRKKMKGRRNGLAWTGSNIDFGDYGLIALEDAFITSRQIEAARIAITRHMKRLGKVWIRIFRTSPSLQTCRNPWARQGSRILGGSGGPGNAL